LQDEIVDQGCTIYYSDEVQLFYGQTKLTGIRLRSGSVIDCDALVFAIGTVPNIEIARAAGLEQSSGRHCRRLSSDERTLISMPSAR